LGLLLLLLLLLPCKSLLTGLLELSLLQGRMATRQVLTSSGQAKKMRPCKSLLMLHGPAPHAHMGVLR